MLWQHRTVKVDMGLETTSHYLKNIRELHCDPLDSIKYYMNWQMKTPTNKLLQSWPALHTVNYSSLCSIWIWTGRIYAYSAAFAVCSYSMQFGAAIAWFNMALYYDIPHSSTALEAEHKSDIIPTTDIPYHNIMGKLWAVFCGDLAKTWQRYNDGITL